MTYKQNPKAVVHQVNHATAVELNGLWTVCKHSNSVDCCAPCLKFIEQMRGGRPKSEGVIKILPFDISLDDAVSHLYTNVPIIDTSNIYIPNRTEAQKQNDTCQVYKSVFPLHTVYFHACGHLFCSMCVSTLFKVKLTSKVACSTCCTITPFSNICKPNLQIITCLRDLVVAGFDYNKSTSREETVGHTCQGNQSTIAPTITIWEYFRQQCQMMSVYQRFPHLFIIPQIPVKFKTLQITRPRKNTQYQSQSQSQSQYQCQHWLAFCHQPRCCWKMQLTNHSTFLFPVPHLDKQPLIKLISSWISPSIHH